MAEVLLSLPEFIGIVYDVVDKIRTVLQAKKEAQRLADQFEATADLITTVVNRLKRLERPSGSRDPLLLAVNDLHPLIQQLNKVFKEIRDKLEPRRGIKEVFRRVKWIEDKDAVKGLLSDLEALKSALSLALTYNSATSATSAQDVSSKLSEALSRLQVDLDDRLIDLQSGVDELRTTANAERREELIEKLSRRAGETAKEDLAVNTPSPDHFGRWLLS